MSTTTSAHSAVPSAAGYYHQGLFALIVLLDAGDDASVSVETGDDVVLHEKLTSLHQLKHSLGTPPALTLKNDGLWNTLAFWADEALDGTVRFVFATCAAIAPGSDLELLKERSNDRSVLLAALEKEADRVKTARLQAHAKGGKLPYATRGPDCERFLKLSAARRKNLVDLITIMPDSFTAVDVPKEVAHRLQYCVPPKVRGAVVERLIEWWDRQVVLSLLDQRSRFLTKFELQARLQELIVEHSLVGLPDEYGDKKPDSVAAETGPVMEQQIIWVKGGNARIQRAAIARWRARNQRDKWLDGDFAAAAELANFDRRLVDTWWGHFGPIKEDCEGRPDDICRTLGLELLEWSHFAALNEIPPIRPHAPHSYIVQGSLQQLAEEGTVGWHPRYKELLASFMSAQRT